MASIAAAKTTIEATPSKREIFEEAADFLILNAPQIKPSMQTQRVSTVDVGEYNQNDLDDYQDVTIEDRLYTVKEYKSLSKNQKHKLKLLRDKRGNNNRSNSSNGSGKRRNNNKSDKKNIFKKIKAENEKMKLRIASLESSSQTNTDQNQSTNTPEESSTTDKNRVVRFNQRAR